MHCVSPVQSHLTCLIGGLMLSKVVNLRPPHEPTSGLKPQDLLLATLVLLPFSLGFHHSPAVIPSSKAMDLSAPIDYPADAAYSPHIVNEQDQPQEDTTAIQNGHSSQPATATPPIDHDVSQRYNSPSLSQQPHSRPDSGMGGQQTQPQYQENRQAQPANKGSVVIKVGMVGDAQIGKTSLMVKYVEGSWDEDYIQTLGTMSPPALLCLAAG